MRVKRSIIIALLGVIGVFWGCGGNNTSQEDKTGNANNALHDKDIVKGSDDISGKDGALIDAVSDSAETTVDNDMVCPKKTVSYNPNAWKDDQVCLKWKRIKPEPKCFLAAQVNVNGCECGKPPYCWCVYREGVITGACSPDKKICCNFPGSCIPCGWHVLTQEERDKMHWDFNKKNSPECEELVEKVERIDPNTEYRACYEWKK